MGSSCVLADNGTTSLQRGRGVKRRRKPTGDKSDSRKRRGGSGRRFWRSAHGRRDVQDQKLRAFSLCPGRGWQWWLLQTSLGWGRTTNKKQYVKVPTSLSVFKERKIGSHDWALPLDFRGGRELNPCLSSGNPGKAASALCCFGWGPGLGRRDHVDGGRRTRQGVITARI